MKRKFLSLILALLLLPGAMFISACGKEKNYNLESLSNDFYAIADTENDTIVRFNNKLEFNYAHYSNNGDEFVNYAIQNISLYGNLITYNQLFNNLMSFSYSYIGACSTKIKVSESVVDSLENSLEELHGAMKEVNSSTDMFASPLKITAKSDMATNFACKESFKNLLTSYEVLFQKAIAFSNNLENIYFNYVLTNPNPKVLNIELKDFDANIVVNNLDARIKWQTANLTKAYLEMHILDGDVAENVKNGANIDLYKSNYLSNVNNISYKIDAQVAAEIANNSANKANFYNLSAQANSAQTMLANDTNKFINAINSISYINVKNNSSTATEVEKLNVKVVEDYNYLLGEYNKVLTSIVNIVKE